VFYHGYRRNKGNADIGAAKKILTKINESRETFVKQSMRKTFTFFTACAALLGWSYTLFGQSVHDECSTAIPVSNPANYCSDPEAFRLFGATPSPQPRASCAIGVNQDVWFTFVAVAEYLSVRVIGRTGRVFPGGTLLNPEVSVFEGTCNGLTQVGCLSDAFSNHIVELNLTGFVPGRQYYIRVDSRVGSVGSFQLCMNNYEAVPDPSSDCRTGVLLCDKSTFSIPRLVGAGSDPNEVGGTCIQEEFSSAWYKWTCDQSGPLSFTLNPNSPADDLDFAVYELPNGIDDCSGKRLLRCMASGENLGAPLEDWIRCYGATGLRFGSNDIVESPGCQSGDDNFLAPINMEQGKSYALVVNNFSNTGSGFTIEFGGSGTFLGPKAAFDIVTDDPEKICRRVPLEVVDKSESVLGGGIVSWNWLFGQGIQPAIRRTQGPHAIQYDEPGYKTITLRIENEKGCIVSTTRRILVECCDYPVSIEAQGGGTFELGEEVPLNVEVDLPGSQYTYRWFDPQYLSCSDCPDPVAITGKPRKFYVEVEDEQGCLAFDSIFINIDIIRPIFIPDAFTPNRNGINDKFTVFGSKAATQVNVLKIFDRWGGLLYEGKNLPINDTSMGWDGTFQGKELMGGTYVFYAEIAFLDEEVVPYAGEITLIR
jgi:gliding motility-associated-like protein